MAFWHPKAACLQIFPTAASYLRAVKRLVPSDPVILIDESDVVKPDGKQFESLGIVRDITFNGKYNLQKP